MWIWVGAHRGHAVCVCTCAPSPDCGSLSAALIALERKMPQFEKNSIQSLTSFLSLFPSLFFSPVSLSFSPTTFLQSHRTIYKSTRSQWNSSPSEEKHKVESLQYLPALALFWHLKFSKELQARDWESRSTDVQSCSNRSGWWKWCMIWTHAGGVRYSTVVGIFFFFTFQKSFFCSTVLNWISWFNWGERVQKVLDEP